MQIVLAREAQRSTHKLCNSIRICKYIKQVTVHINEQWGRTRIPHMNMQTCAVSKWLLSFSLQSYSRYAVDVQGKILLYNQESAV